MPCKQRNTPPKTPPRRAPKKAVCDPSVSKEKIVVLKHFHPDVSYNKMHVNCDLPEVNCDVDVREAEEAKKSERPLRKPRVPWVQKPQSCHEVFTGNREAFAGNRGRSKSRKSDQSWEVTNNETVGNSAAISPRFRSRSYVDDFRGTANKKPEKKCAPVKSRSFFAEDKDKRYMWSQPRNQKRTFISMSSSDIDETYINNLRKEIQLSKRETTVSWQSKKSHLLQNNKIFNDKVENLRKEISKLINNHLEEKRERITELRTEIAEFMREPVVCNVHNEGGPKNVKKMQPKSRDGTGSEVETCVGTFDDSPVELPVEMELVLRNEGNLQICDCRYSRPSGTPTKRSSSRSSTPTDSPTRDGKGARKKTFKSCQPSLPNQQYIDSKIFEVNTLIEKVKDTLHDIKTNAKMKDPDVPPKVSMDKGTYTEETFIAQVVYENVQNGEDGRPKTRRIDILDQDMFRDFISEADESRMEQLTSLERLQLKLNTISEMNESDLSSNLSSSSAPAVCKGAEKVTTVTSCCNTEPVVQKTQETQAEPEVKSSSTQIVTEILDSITQTTPDLPKRVLTIENTTQYEITEPLHTTKKLTLQNLPPINITGDLVCQKIHQLSIDPDGRTHVHYASGQHNVAYVEVHGHDDLFGSHPSVIDIKKKVKMLTDVDSNNVSYLALEDDNMSVCSNADPVVVNQLKGVTNPVIRASNGTKELVYKSFQLLDNPNMHDPGELSSQDMDVTAIDTSVYKTFINPEGFPDTSSDVDRNTVRSKSFLKHHISSMAGTSFANKLSMIEKDFKLLSNVSRDVTELSLDHHKANYMKSTDKLDSSRVEINSKLWDIGLYCSKGVQCCNLPKTKKHVDDSRHDRISLDNRDPVISASSYERISLTVSYSTDSSESLDITEPSLGKTEDRSAEDRVTPAEAPNHEMYSKKVPKVPSPILRRVNSRSDEAGEAAIPKQKQADEDRSSSASISRYARKKQDSEAKKSDPERADEDRASSASISRYSRKKQDSEMKRSDPELEESDTAVDSFISGLLNTKSDELRKVIPRLRKPSKDKSRQFTVLPLQIHGDCWPGQQPKNPHLKLADNGRYKDEENLFSKSSFVNLEDVSMRRRALRCLPPRYCYRNFSLMAQNSDSVSMDDTISEGEVKCECSGSMGEVHRCKSLEPTSTMRQQRPENRSFKDEVSGTVRERRSYFNNLITYFVDKKAQFSDRSSPNSR